MNQSKPKILEVAAELAFCKPFLHSLYEKFGPEFTRHAAMATSVGGIGPLLKDRIRGQAEAGMDVLGVSLLYDNVWEQIPNPEHHLNLKLVEVGSKLKSVLKKADFQIEFPLFTGEAVKADVYELDLQPGRVFYLNAPPYTDVVYPGPVDAPKGTKNPGLWAHEEKLKQSWVLGRGALALAKKIGFQPSLTVLSETPTVFAFHKLFQDAFQKDPFFEKTRYVFNDHTPLEYAHPKWDKRTSNLVKLDPALYENNGAWNPIDKHLDLTCVIVAQSEMTYGVAKLHGGVIQNMASLKPFAEKITYVTNGVKKDDWQADAFMHIEDLSGKDLEDAKRRFKDELLGRKGLWKNYTDEEKNVIRNRHLILLTRRITPYKRLDVLNTLLSDPKHAKELADLNLFIVVGGRVHQQDDVGQRLAKDYIAKAQKPEWKKAIAFFDNFNIWDAPALYRACDGSIMMSDKLKEASATGFMKAMMNGAAIIGSPDGAVPEFVNFSGENQNGFEIAYHGDHPTMEGLFRALRSYSEVFSDPIRREKFRRSAMAATAGLDISRTVKDMNHLYEKILSQPALS